MFPTDNEFTWADSTKQRVNKKTRITTTLPTATLQTKQRVDRKTRITTLPTPTLQTYCKQYTYTFTDFDTDGDLKHAIVLILPIIVMLNLYLIPIFGVIVLEQQLRIFLD